MCLKLRHRKLIMKPEDKAVLQIQINQHVLITMTHQKIGDFIMLTPHLQCVSLARGKKVLIGVPDILYDFYIENNFFQNMIRVSELKNISKSEFQRIIDLTYPLIPEKKVPPEYDGLSPEPFNLPQHVSVSYSQALNQFFSEVDPAFQAKPFIDLDIDLNILNRISIEPFQYFTVHPGSDFAPKNWPLENFENTIELIYEEFPNLKCVALIGPSDKLLFQHKDAPSQFINIELPFKEMAHVLAGSAFHIDNDSGIHHLAGALDVPTISVWGPTGPGTWGSMTQKNFIHWGGPNCSEHCGGLKMSQCSDRICLSSVKPLELLASIRKILASYATSSFDQPSSAVL